MSVKLESSPSLLKKEEDTVFGKTVEHLLATNEDSPQIFDKCTRKGSRDELAGLQWRR